MYRFCQYSYWPFLTKGVGGRGLGIGATTMARSEQARN